MSFGPYARQSRIRDVRCVAIATLIFVVTFTSSTHTAHARSVARFDTVLGVFDVELDAAISPVTVANFFDYVDDGDFTNSLVHRGVPNFVIQGGGYTYNNGGTPGTSGDDNIVPIPMNPPIDNEFQPGVHTNVRGTIAMARSLDPNSATSHWYVNLNDNTFLDQQSGGFTTFGRVREQDMPVIDAIGALPTIRYSSIIPELPVRELSPNEEPITDLDVVIVRRILRLGDLNGSRSLDAGDIDRLFAHIRNAEPYDLVFDINRDTTVDQSDVNALVRELIETLPGDANLNGSVTIGDLTVLAENFDQPGGWAQGDFTGNGVVSIGDLTVLAENFSFSIGLTTAVPVPSTMCLLLATALIATRRRSSHTRSPQH